MKANELTKMSQADLTKKLTELKEELFNLRFQLVTGQLDNSARLGEVKRTIARIMTELREREIAAAEREHA